MARSAAATRRAASNNAGTTMNAAGLLLGSQRCRSRLQCPSHRRTDDLEAERRTRLLDVLLTTDSGRRQALTSSAHGSRLRAAGGTPTPAGTTSRRSRPSTQHPGSMMTTTTMMRKNCLAIAVRLLLSPCRSHLSRASYAKKW